MPSVIHYIAQLPVSYNWLIDSFLEQMSCEMPFCVEVVKGSQIASLSLVFFLYFSDEYISTDLIAITSKARGYLFCQRFSI